MISPPSTYAGMCHIDGKWVQVTGMCTTPDLAAAGAESYAAKVSGCRGCKVVDDQGNHILIHWG